ncbi:hypothetical protein D3C86_1442570 [compost metagenome]
MIAQQERGTNAEGDVDHFVLGWHEAHQAEHGQDVSDSCQHAGTADGAQSDLAAQAFQRLTQVFAQQVNHRERTRQHNADVAGRFQGAGLVFGVRDDRVKAPAAEHQCEHAGEVLDDGEHQHQFDGSVHRTAKDDEALDHQVGQEP